MTKRQIGKIKSRGMKESLTVEIRGRIHSAGNRLRESDLSNVKNFDAGIKAALHLIDEACQLHREMSQGAKS